MDGTHDGRYNMNGHEDTLPGCRGGERAIPADEGGGAENRVPFRVYYPDLPTNPDAVLVYLREDTRGEGTGAYSGTQDPSGRPAVTVSWTVGQKP